VIAKKHGGGRGQAFVVFEEQRAATTAMRSLSDELFYDKKIVCPPPSTLHLIYPYTKGEEVHVLMVAWGISL
jgi:hypothetical protein